MTLSEYQQRVEEAVEYFFEDCEDNLPDFAYFLQRISDIHVQYLVELTQEASERG